MSFIPYRGVSFFAERSFWTCLLVAVGIGGAASTAAAEPYLLGPMDKLHLRIAEWRTSTGEPRDWTMLNGDYMVSPVGTIAVPLLGEVEAEGHTTADTARSISDRLQQKFGMSDRPEAALEVTEFRPLYVSGDVKSPGAFPYAPGMTVLKVVSLSGGDRRVLNENLRIERDLLQAQGNRDVFVANRNRLVARAARLEAEIAGRKEIAMPSKLSAVPNRDALIADELAILLADEQRVALQLQSLSDLKELLQKEITSLGEKRVTLEKQLVLFTTEVKNVGTLANRGLVVNTRISGLQTSVADLQGRLLDLDTAVLRARQDINKADQDGIALRNDRAAKLAADRQETDADIAEAELKIGMQDGLAREAVMLDPALGGVQQVRRVRYAITRVKDGEFQTFAAQPNTEVEPGDVVEVTIDLPQSMSSY